MSVARRRASVLLSIALGAGCGGAVRAPRAQPAPPHDTVDLGVELRVHVFEERDVTVVYLALRARDLPCDPPRGKVVRCGRYRTYQAGAAQRTAVETALAEAKLTAATALFLQQLEERSY